MCGLMEIVEIHGLEMRDDVRVEGEDMDRGHTESERDSQVGECGGHGRVKSGGHKGRGLGSNAATPSSKWSRWCARTTVPRAMWVRHPGGQHQAKSPDLARDRTQG